MSLLKQIVQCSITKVVARKHCSDDGKPLGKYVMWMPSAFPFRDGRYINEFNIHFKPVEGMHIEQAVRESIKLSDKYKMMVWMKWFDIFVYIPYKTNDDDKTVQEIVDAYRRNYANAVKSREHIVGAC